MKGFTSFLKDPPAESNSWFFAKKQSTDDYVVTAPRAAPENNVLELDASVLAETDRFGEGYAFGRTSPAADVLSDNAPSDIQLRERYIRHQRSKMKDWWVADKMAKQCYECRTNFTVLTRRHHCRVCGQIFCHKCSDNFLPGHRLGFAQDTVRLCQCCYAVWQADKTNNDTTTGIGGPLSMKAQGIARQVSIMPTRQRATSDTRNNPSPGATPVTSPGRKVPTPGPEPPLPRASSTQLSKPVGVTRKSSFGNFSEVDFANEQRSPPFSTLDDFFIDQNDAAHSAAAGANLWENAECSFLTSTIGVDYSKEVHWRNKVQRLVEERLAPAKVSPLDRPHKEETKLIAAVHDLDDAPTLLKRTGIAATDTASDASTPFLEEDETCLMQDDEAKSSLERAAHNHLRNLVYRMLGDLIITGCDRRGLLPEDDRLEDIQQHLKPIIKRALWGAPLPAKVAPMHAGDKQLPNLSQKRANTAGKVDPPRDSEAYSHNAASAVAGALFGLEIKSLQDLDVAVVEAVRSRPNNFPESIVCILLSNPMMTTITVHNENVIFARHIENTFIESFPQEFILSEGVLWLKERYSITEEDALECIEILYKRGAIISEAEGTEQLTRSYRDRLGVLKFGEPKEKERQPLDKRRVYHILRGSTVLEEDNLTPENIQKMLEGFRTDFMKDDMRCIDLVKWTKVVCRLAWKSALTLLPCVWQDKDDVMDIRQYIKVVSIPGSDPWDCEYVHGTVIKGNTAHRDMPTEIWNPRILLLSEEIEHERRSVRTDFSTIVQGQSQAEELNEGTWLEQLSNRVEVMRPSVVLVEKSVDLRVQDNLCSSGIALATSVSADSLKRAQKATRAHIVNQLTRIPIHYLQAAGTDDETVPGAPRLGRCSLFRSCKVGGQPLLYLCGGNDEKGCAIVLRGASLAILKRLKVVVKFAAYTAHNLLLESHYLDDAHACLADRQYNDLPDIPYISKSFSLHDSNKSTYFKQESTDSTQIMNEFTDIRDSTELLSASLCVDFEMPEELLAKGKGAAAGAARKDKEQHQQQLLQQHLAQMEGSPTALKQQKMFDQTPSIYCASPLASDGGRLETKGSDTETASLTNSLQSTSMMQPAKEYSLSCDKPPFDLQLQQQKRRARLTALCHELCYLNPLFHQSIMVHDTVTEVIAETENNERRDRSASVFDNTMSSIPPVDRRVSMFQQATDRKQSVVAKDLAGQAHQFGFGQEREADSAVQVSSEGKSTLVDTRHALRMPGGTAKFKKLLIEYYKIGKNKGSDIPIVFYLAEHFSQASSATSNAILTRQYSHNQGRLTVTSEKTDDLFSCDFVVMWAYCKKCEKEVTPRVECSPFTLSYSFGKFLESSFYNFKACSRRCGHSLHGDLIRCFGQRVDGNNEDKVNVQVKFEYQPVEVYTLKFPEMECYYDASKFNAFIESEYQDLTDSIRQGYTSVKDGLDEVERFYRENSFEEALMEEVLVSRQRIMKDCATAQETALLVLQAVPFGASTVMEFNKLRKTLHTSLQNWSKELNERIYTAPVEDKREKRKWKPRFSRDDTNSTSRDAKVSHLTTSSFDLQDTEGFNMRDVPPYESPSDMCELPSPNSPTMPNVASSSTIPQLPLQGSASIQRKFGDFGNYANTSPRQSVVSPVSGLSSPRGEKGETSENQQVHIDPATQSPPHSRSPNRPEGLLRFSSGHANADTGFDYEGFNPPSVNFASGPSQQTPSGSVASLRKLSMPAGKTLHAQRSESLAIALPASIGGPGVLMYLATGVDGMTIIVRLDEPTSMIAHTLCCSQHRRACQPDTPPISPAAGPRQRCERRGTTMLDTGEAPPERHNSERNIHDAQSPLAGDHLNNSGPLNNTTSSIPQDADEAPGRSRAKGYQFELSDTKKKQGEIDALSEVLGEKMLRVDIKEFEEMNSWADGSKLKQQPCLRFVCVVYCARQFAALRQYYCKGDESALLASLSRCASFAPTGGKTGASYYKTLDDRYVLKAIKNEELGHFENKMAKKYFEYMARAIKSKMPTLLVKILGVFRIEVRRDGKESSSNNWMLMENLFYNRKVDRMFDLKGSTRNRYQANKEAVLLDENLLHLVRDGKWIFTTEESKETLNMGVHNDTLMLRRNDIMDYSMLLGLDDEKKEIYVGIIDYMREYDMKKQLEFLAKSTVAGRGQQPTVVDPNKYKERFRAAMNNYFLMLPDKATPWVIKHKKYQTLTGPGSELVFDLH